MNISQIENSGDSTIFSLDSSYNFYFKNANFSRFALTSDVKIFASSMSRNQSGPMVPLVKSVE